MTSCYWLGVEGLEPGIRQTTQACEKHNGHRDWDAVVGGASSSASATQRIESCQAGSVDKGGQWGHRADQGWCPRVTTGFELTVANTVRYGGEMHTSSRRTRMRGEGGTDGIPSMALCTSSAYRVRSVPLGPRKSRCRRLRGLKYAL